MDTVKPTALIAEDEPLLAMALRAELARAWPTLDVVCTVGDGRSAVQQALALTPDLLFFDIRMPGLDGLDAAAELADAWPSAVQPGAKPFPLLVFTTAYDQYAVRAFDVHAVDYLLKPIQGERLRQTVARLQQALNERQTKSSANQANHTGAHDDALQHAAQQLRQLLEASLPATATGTQPGAVPALKVIQASVGGNIRMVPVEEVIYFEAADKYVRVLTAEREFLIRTPLKELLPQLDSQTFWQIHRGTVVRASAIDSVSRDEAGKQYLSLRGCPDKLSVSRLYAHLFKPM